MWMLNACGDSGRRIYSYRRVASQIILGGANSYTNDLKLLIMGAKRAQGVEHGR